MDDMNDDEILTCQAQGCGRKASRSACAEAGKKRHPEYKEYIAVCPGCGSEDVFGEPTDEELKAREREEKERRERDARRHDDW